MLPLSAEPHFSLRAALLARFSLTKVFGGGARIDYLHYLTPDARSNTQDLLRDQAMRPVVDPDYPGLKERLYVQSRWENEAVNAMIISPFLIVDFNDLGSIQLVYSHGFYKKPVVRHGTVSTQHSNVSLIANVILSKTGSKNLKNSLMNSIKMKQPENSQSRNSICPVMGNPVNDSLYVDMKDKRIFICCPACSMEIVKNPSKYIQ